MASLLRPAVLLHFVVASRLTVSPTQALERLQYKRISAVTMCVCLAINAK